MRAPFEYAGGSTTHSQNVTIDDQYTQNYYPEIEGPGATAQISLRPTPGLLRLFDAGVGPARSDGIEFMGKLYYVSGNKLIECATDLASGVEVGTLSTNGGRVSMDASPTELGIVDGTSIYRWDGTTFSTIADADAPNGANTITWLDFYFICEVSGTGRFQISALNDLTSWDALDFATAESSRDDLIAVKATTNELWLIGEWTTEIYYNSGNPVFPFEPMGHGVIMVGTKSPHTVRLNQNGELTWLATYREGGFDIIKASTGGRQIISDANIARRINDQSSNNIDDAYASVYGQAGHSFYVLNFPDGSTPITMVYDYRTTFWHDRLCYGLTRHRCAGIGYYNKKVVVFDYNGSTVYQWKLDQYDDNGDMIQRIRRMAILSNNGLPLMIDSIEIEFKPGTAGAADQTFQVALRYSKTGRDGTYTPDLVRTNKQGEYKGRFKWGPLGRGYRFHIETTVTSKAEVVVGKAYLNVRSGFNA